MVLGKMFERFLDRRPVCVVVRAVLERLVGASVLDQLFESTARVQYCRELLFSQTVEVLGRVVTRSSPSVLAAYEALRDDLSVSDQAVYDKLQGVEPPVCQALVRHSFKEASGVLEELNACDQDWLSGFRLKILDGNHIASTEHRLKELRTVWEAPLPGVTLVVWDQRTRLIRDIFLNEDGHAQERSMLGQLQETVEADDLWIADRNFCTLLFIFCLMSRRARFVIRQHGQLKGKPEGERLQVGLTAEGQPIYEQTLILTCEGQERRVRRITICLAVPTRDGATELHLLTNLPAHVSGQVIGELYRKRWTIEAVFNELTVGLKCEVNTLGYPKAALFAFSIAVLLENSLGLLKRAIATVHPDFEGELSGHRMATELSSCYDGMLVAIPPEEWEIFRTLTNREFALLLKDMLQYLDPRDYEVRKRGPKKPKPKRVRVEKEIHVSIAKILAIRQAK